MIYKSAFYSSHSSISILRKISHTECIFCVARFAATCWLHFIQLPWVASQGFYTASKGYHLARVFMASWFTSHLVKWNQDLQLNINIYMTFHHDLLTFFMSIPATNATLFSLLSTKPVPTNTHMKNESLSFFLFVPLALWGDARGLWRGSLVQRTAEPEF